MSESVEVGWAAMAKMLKKSLPTVQARKKELESLGVIFYMRHGCPGGRMVHFFPSMVIRWLQAKTVRGEKI
jgi:hypothetical protein